MRTSPFQKKQVAVAMVGHVGSRKMCPDCTAGALDAEEDPIVDGVVYRLLGKAGGLVCCASAKPGRSSTIRHTMALFIM